MSTLVPIVLGADGLPQRHQAADTAAHPGPVTAPSATVSGAATVGSLTCSGLGTFGASGSGVAVLNGGSSSLTGYLGLLGPSGNQLGYFGYMTAGSGNAINLVNQQGGGLTCQVSAISPASDNVTDLGLSSTRFRNLYLAASAIMSSDARLKQWRDTPADASMSADFNFTAAELAAARDIARSIGVFQWLKEIADKGGEVARWHIGPKAQAVFAILARHGLDTSEFSSRYAFACYDRWDAIAPVHIDAVPEVEAFPGVPARTDEDGNVLTWEVEPVAYRAAVEAIDIPGREAGDLFGIRADQLAMFCIAAQEQRLTALEARPST